MMNKKVMDNFYVCNHKGAYQGKCKLFDNEYLALRYFQRMVREYPHIKWEVRKNASYGGYFEKILAEN